ncbi:MAG: hypothetical protein ABJC05_00600 [Pyrinomonadaceae bacterium]
MPIKRFASIGLILLLAMLSGTTSPAMATGDDFNAAVKVIEQFYNVRHKGLPWMARAGMKAATTAARMSGGDRKRIAEAGSVKVAFFEDQDFSSRGRIGAFRSSMNGALIQSWSPLVQTLSPKDEEQTYIYLREANEKFQVLVVTIERREAVVVQATVNPRTLAQLMKNPDEMGREITNDATTNDNDEE